MYRIYVCDALKEFKSYRSAIEKWSNPEPYLYQLELPGDIWNTEFFNRIYDDFIAPLTKDHKAPIAPRALRDIYKKFSDELRERGLYPEQFDVTFDFARLCREKSCYMCPLSPKHPYVEKLCIGNLSRPKQKYCSLLLTICEYFTLCNPDKCPVFDKSIKGLCPKPEIILSTALICARIFFWLKHL